MKINQVILYALGYMAKKKKVLFSRKFLSYESKDHEILTIYNVSFFLYIYIYMVVLLLLIHAGCKTVLNAL